MKRYLLLFALLFCFSCSSEDDDEIVEEETFKEWRVRTMNACDSTDSTINNTYGVTEETHDVVYKQWMEDYFNGVCEEITFEDINGNEITSIISSVGYGTVTESTSNCQ